MKTVMRLFHDPIIPESVYQRHLRPLASHAADVATRLDRCLAGPAGTVHCWYGFEDEGKRIERDIARIAGLAPGRTELRAVLAVLSDVRALARRIRRLGIFARSDVRADHAWTV